MANFLMNFLGCVDTNARLRKTLFAAVLCGILAPVACLAQQATGPVDLPPKNSSSSSEEAKLIDGLLDLINEPSLETPKSAGKPDVLRPPETLDIQPTDVGLYGEDLGEDQANPLKAIRQSMFIAAGYLERGVTSGDTQTIQQDILQRLDELISQIEQPESNDSRTQSSKQPPSQAQSQPNDQQRQQTQGSQQTASAPKSNAGEGNVSKEGEMTSSSPGSRGSSGQAILELSDPVALQQSLWGQLPERVRKQMQSQMVERFLPSYRDQIEAYFQALLRQQQD